MDFSPFHNKFPKVFTSTLVLPRKKGVDILGLAMPYEKIQGEIMKVQTPKL